MKIFNKQKGDIGENIAENYLKRQGYKIIRRNFKTKVSEIDIIAVKDKILTFVEVKSRANDEYGMPYEAVDTRKMNKIRQGAEIFLLSNDIFYDGISFDIVEVILNNASVNHIVSAF